MREKRILHKMIDERTEKEDGMEDLKKRIFELIKEYYKKYRSNQSLYQSGDRISYAGRVFDESELVNLVDASLEFWLTSGRYCKEFETRLSDYLGVRYCSLVNSGSSANLLALMSLTSPLLKDRRLKRGDEVITVAAGFPTTIAPIIQYGAVPVFVDVDKTTANIDVSMLKAALSRKTKAVMIAHTLGNPFDLEKVSSFCKEHSLWLIEDNCDALGSEYLINGEYKKTGTIGDIGTSSFYPPHHMTMGEGGAVYTDHPLLHKIIRSMRDWGRDCSCESGQDNRCGARYENQYGLLPQGYDHKYVYSHFGYNLKATEMQAAIGVAQLDKLPEFTNRRIKNYEYLRKGLQALDSVFDFQNAQENSKPSWFGFMLIIKETAGFTRAEIIDYLEHTCLIQTRNLFAGNIIDQPCFDLLRDCMEEYRVVGELKNTDIFMKNAFWIGVYPGMDKKRLDEMIKRIKDFVEKRMESR